MDLSQNICKSDFKTKSNKKRNIKNKNMSLEMFLQHAFNFKYAGKCEVFLHTRGKQFELVHYHVHIVGDTYLFSPNYVARFKFETLYLAIKAFNLSVSILTESMDWYDPKMFNPIDYDEVYLKD